MRGWSGRRPISAPSSSRGPRRRHGPAGGRQSPALAGAARRRKRLLSRVGEPLIATRLAPSTRARLLTKRAARCPQGVTPPSRAPRDRDRKAGTVRAQATHGGLPATLNRHGPPRTTGAARRFEAGQRMNGHGAARSAETPGMALRPMAHPSGVGGRCEAAMAAEAALDCCAVRGRNRRAVWSRRGPATKGWRLQIAFRSHAAHGVAARHGAEGRAGHRSKGAEHHPQPTSPRTSSASPAPRRRGGTRNPPCSPSDRISGLTPPQDRIAA